MRIGELPKTTGIDPRMLRYCEEQRLSSQDRLSIGFLVYGEYLVDRVSNICALMHAGIPMRIIAGILPCLGKPPTIVVENADPELRATLSAERDRMVNKIEFLTLNRDGITAYFDALEKASTRANDYQRT